MQLQFCHAKLMPLLIEHINTGKANSYTTENITGLFI